MTAMKETATPPPRPRMGPRPLGLHLALAAGSLGASSTALTGLTAASPGWSDIWPHPDLREAARRLEQELQQAAKTARAAQREKTEAVNGAVNTGAGAGLEQAVADAAARRLALFLDGVTRYRAAPFTAALPPPRALWTEGTTRLLDYGGGGKPLLIIPSLVNRYHVLDLAADNSFARRLAQQGLRPLIVDWDAPGAAENAFTLNDYIKRLERLLRFLRRDGAAPLPLLGYCMGGLLALALAERAPQAVERLALLATPWDFHAGGGDVGLGVLLPFMERATAALGFLPTDAIQTLFLARDPLLGLRKFIRFAALPKDGGQEKTFVALEDWLNDGVPLAGPAALECLRGWYRDNEPGRGCWRPGGRAVTGAAFAGPALCLIPANDRIVPADSALALARSLPGAHILTPPAGHIGMVAGRAAERYCRRPVADFALGADRPS